MASLRCPHADHHGQPAQLNQTAAGFWTCFLNHSFEIAMDASGVHLRDLQSFARHSVREGHGVELLSPFCLQIFEDDPVLTVLN